MANLRRSRRSLLYFLLLALAILNAGEAAWGDDKPLAIRDIARMRRDRVPPESIVEKATDQGVGFAVTPAVEKQLARLGFTPEQIDSIRQAAVPPDKPDKPGKKEGRGANGDKGNDEPAPIQPGHGLPSSDDERDRLLEQITKITKLSGVDVQPFAARHVTLWSAKDDQAAFLADLKKIDRYLEGKCQEPLRSGLDKRSAHLVLLKTRYDYEKWITPMFDVLPWTGKLPDAPDPEAGSAELKASILKAPSYITNVFVVICLEGQEGEQAHRRAATGVGFMNLMQQVGQLRHDPLATGFANVIESLVAGSPATMIFGSRYQSPKRDMGNAPRTWLRLVQERMRTKKESSLRGLLKMDMTNMKLPHFAEAWTFVGLLTRQPEKFAKLVLALREEKETLKAIEDVYGWDEKKLEAEWHKDVLGQR
jgi:hypothetical protein